MSDPILEFKQQYTSALQDYLAGAGEAALQRAYELGRNALGDTLTLLDIAAIHKETLNDVLSGIDNQEETVRTAEKAIDFFVESLAPFEMTHRGFREANARLRLISEHVQSVREEERATVAREIHDNLGQSLTGLKLDLSWLARRVFRQKTGSPSGTKRKTASVDRQALRRKTESMLSSIDTVIQMVRKISAELRPAVLDDLGLAAAIEWQTREFQGRTEIACHLHLPSENLRLDRTMSTAMFRIFQEALTNVARHANATTVNISLRKKDDSLILEVKDNGKGVAKSSVSDSRSLGILGMRERASFLGGEVDISGAEGKGTTVTVRMPINK